MQCWKLEWENLVSYGLNWGIFPEGQEYSGQWAGFLCMEDNVWFLMKATTAKPEMEGKKENKSSWLDKADLEWRSDKHC